MTFVVVYLLRAREFVVVPETWVLELNSAKLKNNGRNSNQDFLVYCSFQNGEPILATQPNFNTDLEYQFDGNIAEACYICRVKNFFGKLNVFLHYYLLN